jgi:hypothetical protein
MATVQNSVFSYKAATGGRAWCYSHKSATGGKLSSIERYQKTCISSGTLLPPINHLRFRDEQLQVEKISCMKN